MQDPKFKKFQKLIMDHLSKLEEKEPTEKEIQKAFAVADIMMMRKGRGMPVGTIREWKGKKYIKIAPGKWKPKYDSLSRGAKMSIAFLKKKVASCTNSEELLNLVMDNKARFSDEKGNPLPFIKELSDYVAETKKQLESSKTPKAEEKKEDKKEPEQETAKKETSLEDKFRKMMDKFPVDERKKKLEVAVKRGGERGEIAKKMLKELEAKEAPQEEPQKEQPAEKKEPEKKQEPAKEEEPEAEKNKSKDGILEFKDSNDHSIGNNVLSEAKHGNFIYQVRKLFGKIYGYIEEPIGPGESKIRKNKEFANEEQAKEFLNKEALKNYKKSQKKLQKTKETEAEKKENRSNAMKGNDNAKKDGVIEDKKEEEPKKEEDEPKKEEKKDVLDFQSSPYRDKDKYKEAHKNGFSFSVMETKNDEGETMYVAEVKTDSGNDTVVYSYFESKDDATKYLNSFVKKTVAPKPTMKMPKALEFSAKGDGDYSIYTADDSKFHYHIEVEYGGYRLTVNEGKETNKNTAVYTFKARNVNDVKKEAKKWQEENGGKLTPVQTVPDNKDDIEAELLTRERITLQEFVDPKGIPWVRIKVKGWKAGAISRKKNGKIEFPLEARYLNNTKLTKDSIKKYFELYEEEYKKTEAEKHKNRSDAMKGNQNAKKDGVPEDVKTRVKTIADAYTAYNSYASSSAYDSIKTLGENKLRELIAEEEPDLVSYEDFLNDIGLKVAKYEEDHPNEEGLEDTIKGYIENKKFRYDVETLRVEYAKKRLAELKKAEIAMQEEIPVKQKDMEEAKRVIGNTAKQIALGLDTFGNGRQTLIDKIRRRARSEPTVARAMFKIIQDVEKEVGKPVFTKRNSIWELLPKLNEMAKQALESGEDEAELSNPTGTLYSNDTYELSRVETDKGPRIELTGVERYDREAQQLIKRNGFRWTPSRGSWTRLVGGSADYAIKNVVEGLKLKSAKESEDESQKEQEDPKPVENVEEPKNEPINESEPVEDKKEATTEENKNNPTANVIGTAGEKIAIAKASEPDADGAVTITGDKNFTKEFNQLASFIAPEHSVHGSLKQLGVIDGFLYASDGIRVKRLKIDGLENGRTYSYKIDENGVTLTPNGRNDFLPVQRVIPTLNTSSYTLDNKVVKDVIKKYKSNGYLNEKDERIYFPMTAKNGNIYFFDEKIGETGDKNADFTIGTNFRYLLEILSENNKDTIVSYNPNNLNGAISVSTNSSDSVVMPMQSDGETADKMGTPETFLKEKNEADAKETKKLDERLDNLLSNDINQEIRGHIKKYLQGLPLKERKTAQHMLIDNTDNYGIATFLNSGHMDKLVKMPVKPVYKGKLKNGEPIKAVAFELTEDYKNMKKGEVLVAGNKTDSSQFAKLIKYFEKEGYFGGIKKSLSVNHALNRFISVAQHFYK